MKVFIIDIPTGDSCQAYKQCYEILSDYFSKHNIDVFVLQKNEFGVDPSWLKLKCFDYVDDDFVLCWDMDLLPRRGCPSIKNFLDFSKINMVVDTNVITGVVPPHPDAPWHRYNCGLMGIPRLYRGLMERVFSEAKTSVLPSYEQYPMNRELSKNGFRDVHELEKTWNCIFHLPNVKESFHRAAHVVHYTGMEESVRRKLVGIHHRLYFGEVTKS